MKTKTRFHKFTAWLLTVAMLMTFIPSFTAFADGWFTVSGNTVTIDGTLGGKTEASEDDVAALVEQLKAYVDNGITTITVTGSNPAIIDMSSYTNTAIGEAIFRLSGSGTHSADNPYNGKIDLILPAVTEIVDYEFQNAHALNSINLPKVNTIGVRGISDCFYLQELKFGSVVTSIKESNYAAFTGVGTSVDGGLCDLVLSCGQAFATEYQPNLDSRLWCGKEWKSITQAHSGGEATGICTSCGAVRTTGYAPNISGMVSIQNAASGTATGLTNPTGSLHFNWGADNQVYAELWDATKKLLSETVTAQPDETNDNYMRFSFAGSFAGTPTKVLATYGIGDDLTATMPNEFTQSATSDPSFLNDYVMLQGSGAYGEQVNFTHIPALFCFAITNKRDTYTTIDSISIRLVDEEGEIYPIASSGVTLTASADGWTTAFSGEYDKITTTINAELMKGALYRAYAAALPLPGIDPLKGKTMQFVLNLEDGESYEAVVYEIDAESIAAMNGGSYNWVGGEMLEFEIMTDTNCIYSVTAPFVEKELDSVCAVKDSTDTSDFAAAASAPTSTIDGNNYLYNCSIGVTTTNAINTNGLYNVTNNEWVNDDTGDPSFDTSNDQLWGYGSTLTAYAPYSQDYQSITYNLADGNYVLYGKNDTVTGSYSDLTLEHKLASLYVSGLTGTTLQNVELSGIYTTATFNGSTGTLTPTGNKGAIGIDVDRKEILLIPMEEEEVTLRIQLSDGSVYTTKMNLEIEAGNRYVLPVKLGHNGTLSYQVNGDGTHTATWSCCGETVTEDHSGGNPTCTTPDACALCGGNYLNPDNHEYVNGVCPCGAIAPIEKNANGVYEIYVPEQLVEFAQIVNGTHETIPQDKAANAILMDNIDMDGIPWTPICSTGLYYSNSYASGYGTEDTGYAGTFDGDGHVIKNLSVTAIAGETWTYGLFGTMTGTVKNLGIEGFTYNHNGATDMRVGAIVGQLLGGTIENCYVRNATINPGTNVAGGITGCNYAGTIKNCYVADSTVLASSSRYGYIAGDNRADTAGDRLGTIINCYTDAYPLVGSYTSTETDSRTHVSKTDFASGVITWYLNGESAEGIWKQGESYPDFTGTEVTENPINENEVPQVVDGIYQIANKSQMFYFANYVNYVDASASAVLVNDIDLESEEWTPMGNLGNAYTGTFDGKGYTISNLGMNVTEGRQIGLFGYAEGATIKNFKIDGKVVLNYEKFESCYYGVIGSVRGCTIEGIESYVDLEIKDTFAKSSIAGIVGSIEGDQTISKCAFYGTLDYGSADIDCGGGIVGYAGYNQAHVIEDCAFYGTIKSKSETDDQIGGIIGYNRTAGNIMTIKNCVSAGTIDLAKTTFAGVIGGRVLGVGNTNLGYIANNYYYSANSIPAFAQTTGHTYSNIELPDYADYGDGNAKAVDVATLKSGEVTYLLNSGVTDGTQAWYQTLGEDDYPKFSGKTVYYDETETVYYNEKVKVTVDGESVETYGYIVLGTDNGDGTYSLPANVVGYYMDDSFVDAGKYAVVGGEVITTVNFNVTMVQGAQVRYGGGLDANGKVSAGNGLRFLATVDRSEFDGIGYGMKLTAEGSSAETLVDATKWQNDTTFSVAITDMAVSNYNRNFTATPFVKVKYDDGTEKTVYGTESVTRSIYYVAAGLLKTGNNGIGIEDNYGAGVSYGLYDVLNAYVNMVGVRLNLYASGNITASDKYTGDVFFDVASVDNGDGSYTITVTPVTQDFAYPVEIMSYWNEFVRINNNNSVVKNCISESIIENGVLTFKFTLPSGN